MRKFLLITTAMLIVFGMGIAAYADEHEAVPRTGDFSLGVGSDLGSATFTPDPELWDLYSWKDENNKWHDEYSYVITSPVDLLAGDVVIGTIESLYITVDEDPAVALDFVCRAGAAATTFTFTSFLDVSLTNPDAQATATVTATDRNNDGVTIAGLYSDNKCYEANYNPGETVFVHLDTGGTAGAGLSYSTNESTAWVPVAGSVTRMEANYYFTVTARDSASGTSNYQMVEQIIPEPSSLLVLASGLVPGLGLLIRRRRA